VFITSFLLLHAAFQVVSGVVLTMTYTPDVTSAYAAAGQDHPLPQKVSFGTVSFIPWLATLLSATIAYFLSQKWVRSGNTGK
jgi:quinol-cytochrome oxidoreductase complex cytochrome b subunit